MFILLAEKVNLEDYINIMFLAKSNNIATKMCGVLTCVDGEKTVSCTFMLMALKFPGKSQWRAQWYYIQSTKYPQKPMKTLKIYRSLCAVMTV